MGGERHPFRCVAGTLSSACVKTLCPCLACVSRTCRLGVAIDRSSLRLMMCRRHRYLSNSSSMHLAGHSSLRVSPALFAGCVSLVKSCCVLCSATAVRCCGSSDLHRKFEEKQIAQCYRFLNFLQVFNNIKIAFNLRTVRDLCMNAMRLEVYSAWQGTHHRAFLCDGGRQDHLPC